MRKEYATLRRRPFLTPVWLSALAAVVVLVAAGWALRAASTTLVVIVPVAHSDSIPDLGLAALGEVRAAILAPLFGAGDAGTALRADAVVVTQSVAATAVGQPLARHLAVPLSTEPAGDPRGLAARVVAAHRGGRVVIVTESGEVAGLARALAGGEVAAGALPGALVIAIPRFSRPAVLALGLP